MTEKIRVGVVGVGNISTQYLKNAPNFAAMQIVALSDLDMERARARATEFNIPRACTVDELMKDKTIDAVLNLTIPKAHLEVAMQAIESGKHTFAEKPLGIDVAEGRRVIEAAAKKKLRIGCAPDTFMGAGIQTARKVIDDGAIGRPVAFTAFMMCRGHESWHPSPEFYYEVGGGPMFDMGPYYLTALLNMFGPIKRISGMASIAIPQRTITHKNKEGQPGPKFGTKIDVETPDHICGTIEFASGVMGTIVTTFATRFATYDGKQPITVYGTDGTLKVPDPNGFDGLVHIRREGEADWSEVPHAFPKGYGRAVGLADMCSAIQHNRPHRASGEQAFAVLEAMAGFLESSKTGKTVVPTTKYERSAPMRSDLPFGVLD